MTDHPPLRARIKEAGGLYAFINSRLIRYAGPPSVGPFDEEPPAATRAAPCPLCGNPMNAHTFDRSGPKPLMHCP